VLYSHVLPQHWGQKARGWQQWVQVLQEVWRMQQSHMWVMLLTAG
jgi:hypothetical protein